MMRLAPLRLFVFPDTPLKKHASEVTPEDVADAIDWYVASGSFLIG